MATDRKSTGIKTTKRKSWADKMKTGIVQVKLTDKKFADIPAGVKMLIPTPLLIDEYVRKIPKGSSSDILTLRRDLAEQHDADYTCPLTTGIFLRIIAEAAYEQIQQGTPLSKITPFWRVLDERSKVATKLSFGSALITEQRSKEGLLPLNPKKKSKPKSD